MSCPSAVQSSNNYEWMEIMQLAYLCIEDGLEFCKECVSEHIFDSKQGLDCDCITLPLLVAAFFLACALQLQQPCSQQAQRFTYILKG
jgi:hypothetical protein